MTLAQIRREVNALSRKYAAEPEIYRARMEIPHRPRRD